MKRDKNNLRYGHEYIKCPICHHNTFDYVSYSENDFREAFDEFYKLLTDGKRTVNSPKAFLLGGQSGAGKTD